MRIITLHCDYIRFKALKKALKKAEDLKSKEEVEVKEPLVILTAVESGDSNNEIKQLIDSVKKTAKEVKAKNIVLYPYAHLSSNLASPETALSVLEKAEKELKKSFNVTRAPFGYYKSFELKVKGHPLSELSKEFKPETKLKETEADYDPKQLLREISRTKLDTSKLKENDHRILGQKLDLFSFSESAPGSVFWHDKGLTIYNELIKLWREIHQKAGYKEISTPQILDNKIWKISGHWSHYKDNMFTTKYEKRDFGVKPMNCPGAMLVYKTNTRSYKDLPLRLTEIGTVHRRELSGVLAGLFRAIKFTQDDAHIFCTDSQLESEIRNIIEIVKQIYGTFEFKFEVELSTRPKKFMGKKSDWDKSEKALESAMKKVKLKYKINKGDGAFYGPKIDFHIKDSLGRSWQCATIQLDMQMPERFGIKYIDKDNKEKTPLVLHRVVFGSIERFIGILLEHTSGNLPLWLSPIQVRVLSFTDRNIKSAEKLVSDLRETGIRADSDLDSTPINGKVRDAEMQKVPYIIVIGDKEEKSKTIAVRVRGSKPKFGVKSESLIKEIKEKITKRK